LSAFTDLAAPLKARHTREKDMKNIALKEVEASESEVDSGLLIGWLDRANLARELTLSVDALACQLMP
jgi:hypothetical protein